MREGLKQMTDVKKCVNNPPCLVKHVLKTFAWLLSMEERNANCSGLLDNFGEAQFNEDTRKD